MHADWSYNHVITMLFCNRLLSQIEPTQDLPSMDIHSLECAKL